MIFAIDPGSEKTGTALVNEDGTLFKKKIIPTDTLEDMVGRIMSVYNPKAGALPTALCPVTLKYFRP